jgi:hypothetical protein
MEGIAATGGFHGKWISVCLRAKFCLLLISNGK